MADYITPEDKEKSGSGKKFGIILMVLLIIGLLISTTVLAIDKHNKNDPVDPSDGGHNIHWNMDEIDTKAIEILNGINEASIDLSDSIEIRINDYYKHDWEGNSILDLYDNVTVKIETAKLDFIGSEAFTSKSKLNQVYTLSVFSATELRLNEYYMDLSINRLQQIEKQIEEFKDDLPTILDKIFEELKDDFATHWEELKDFIGNYINSINEYLEFITLLINNIVDNLSMFTKKVNIIVNKLLDNWSEYSKDLQQKIAKLVEKIDVSIMQFLDIHAKKIKNLVLQMISTIRIVVDAIVINIINYTFDYILDSWSEFSKELQQKILEFIREIDTKIMNLIDYLITMFNDFAIFITNVIFDIMTNMFDTLINNLLDGWDSFSKQQQQKILEFIRKINNFISKLVDNWYNFIKEKEQNIINDLQRYINQIHFDVIKNMIIKSINDLKLVLTKTLFEIQQHIHYFETWFNNIDGQSYNNESDNLLAYLGKFDDKILSNDFNSKAWMTFNIKDKTIKYMFGVEAMNNEHIYLVRNADDIHNGTDYSKLENGNQAVDISKEYINGTVKVDKFENTYTIFNKKHFLQSEFKDLIDTDTIDIVIDTNTNGRFSKNEVIADELQQPLYSIKDIMIDVNFNHLDGAYVEFRKHYFTY